MVRRVALGHTVLFFVKTNKEKKKREKKREEKKKKKKKKLDAVEIAIYIPLGIIMLNVIF